MQERDAAPHMTSGSAENSDKKEILTEAKTQVKETGKALAAKASETASQAKEEVRRQIDAQKQEVCKQIGDVKHALRHTADNLENPTLGQQLARLADQVEMAADRLEEAELEDVVEAAEDFFRGQPAMFLTGSFFLGLMAARFLRAHRLEPDYSSGRGAVAGSGMTGTTLNREVSTDEHLIGR